MFQEDARRTVNEIWLLPTPQVGAAFPLLDSFVALCHRAGVGWPVTFVCFEMWEMTFASRTYCIIYSLNLLDDFP